MMLWEMGFSLPQAQRSKLKKPENQDADFYMCFLMPVSLPSKRLRKTTSRDHECTHQANTVFRNPVQTRKADFPTVPEGHKHRVTALENPRKIPRTPAEPRRAPQNPRRGPRRTLRETPQSPPRGKFPRRASQRVVPLGWWPSGPSEDLPRRGNLHIPIN